MDSLRIYVGRKPRASFSLFLWLCDVKYVETEEAVRYKTSVGSTANGGADLGCDLAWTFLCVCVYRMNEAAKYDGTETETCEWEKKYIKMGMTECEAITENEGLKGWISNEKFDAVYEVQHWYVRYYSDGN